MSGVSIVGDVGKAEGVMESSRGGSTIELRDTVGGEEVAHT